MQLKLSDYSIFTEKFESEENQEEIHILYPTRSSNTVLISDHLYEKLVRNDFTGIADNSLDRLPKIEALVSADENELQTILVAAQKAATNVLKLPEKAGSLFINLQP
jgi:hypothetical protein